MRYAYEIWSPTHGWVDLRDRILGWDENGCLILADRKIGPLAWRQKSSVIDLDMLRAMKEQLMSRTIDLSHRPIKRMRRSSVCTKPRLTAADLVMLRDMKIGIGVRL